MTDVSNGQNFSPITNSRVTRLHEKLEMMSAGCRQPGTRSSAGCQAHLFPTVIKVSLGGGPMGFVPCLDKICPTSRIASYGHELDCAHVDTSPLTVDRFDLYIPDFRKLSFRHPVPEKDDTLRCAVVDSLENPYCVLRNRMSDER